jgi:hypothetical protein
MFSGESDFQVNVVFVPSFHDNESFFTCDAKNIRGCCRDGFFNRFVDDRILFLSLRERKS